MPKIGIFKKAVDVLAVMNVAVTNIRLYPPTSAIIRNTVDRAYQLFLEILETEDSAIFAESGSNYVVCGGVFDEAEQKRHPQAFSILDIFTKVGVKSIDFRRGLEKKEMEIFLKLISQTLTEIEGAGGLKRQVEAENLPHVEIDHKVYIVVDHDQRLVASVDLKDDDVVRYMTGEQGMGEADVRQIQKMAKDPEWVNKVFQAGMDHLLCSTEEKNTNQVSRSVVQMMQTLDTVSDEMSKPALSRVLSLSIAGMEDEMVVLILGQDLNGLFDKKMLDYIVDDLSDERFEQIATMIRPEEGKAANDEVMQTETSAMVYGHLMKTEKGRQLQERIRQKAEAGKSRQETHVERLKSGLSRILKGDTSALEEPGFTELLPDYFDQLFRAGKGDSAENLLKTLNKSLLDENGIIRENVASIMAHVSRFLMTAQKMDVLTRITPGWLEWLRAEKDRTPGVERITLQIQDMARRFIKSENYQAAAPLIETFSRIILEKQDESPAFEALANEMLRHVASRDVLEQLLKIFDGNDSSQHRDAMKLLIDMGDASVEGLLDILLDSMDMSERVRILRIVSEIGSTFPYGIIRKVEAGGPWYFIRNLILMLGEIGNEDHLPHLIPFLQHEDFRVQRETLNTIYKIGGQYRGEVFLSALTTVDESIKPNVIDMLGALAYAPAVDPFLEMLAQKSLFSAKISDRLKEKICDALGKIGDVRAEKPLKAIAESGKFLTMKSHPEAIRVAAKQALIRIQGEKPVSETPDTSTVAGSEKPSTIEAAILHDRNDDTVEEALIDMLMDGIITYAREKKFDEAEVLRQKLIEMDSMALSEIIRADEIIEKEKREAESAELNQDTLGIWPELYDTLTPEEAGALYYAMEEAVYEPDDTIFEQGVLNDRLYFIQKGELKLVFSSGEREHLLKVVNSGHIVGEDTFFSISVTTTSMATLSYAELSFLDKHVLEEWREQFPALESKLHDYCLRMDRVQDILESKGMDRRVHERIAISGTVSVDLLNSSGAQTGKNFKGNFQDISMGGLSFLIKSPNPKNASLLLGRKLGLHFDFPAILCPRFRISTPTEPDKPLSISHTGTVIGVSYHKAQDYSVHIKFESLLNEILSQQLKNR